MVKDNNVVDEDFYRDLLFEQLEQLNYKEISAHLAKLKMYVEKQGKETEKELVLKR